MLNKFIEKTAKISKKAKIYPNSYVLGDSEIAEDVIIYPGCTIINSKIGKGTKIMSSVIEDSVVGENVSIGPFAHIRPQTTIHNNVHIGNFVEVKNSEVGEGTKMAHLAYVGDAKVGKDCNIGCGAIFVNYNGKTKNKIIVEDNCFIGSNCNLIAPIKLEKNSFICAGTTLTKDTKNSDFVIGRARETIKADRAKKYLSKIV